ncbi:SEC-C metal-binding domain-containing protein [Pedobacter sp.]
MNSKKAIILDVARMSDLFPKLILVSGEGSPLRFSGEIDICDSAGVYWDTFKVNVKAPVNYPHGVPVVQETGSRIERIADRHISPDGFCCVAIDHVLLHHAARGLTVTEFVQRYVYPYLANHLYFEKEGYYADQEYLHAFQGVEQFYRETLNAPNAATAIKLLEGILLRKLPSRNSQCFCGSFKKFKYCHKLAADYLSRINHNRLIEDLNSFKIKYT